jgi:ATP adenylyltransferase
MERIWAPWRIDYVVGKEKEAGCIFCTKPTADQGDDNLIVHVAQGAFTMMNKFPYNNGHVLVSPYRHVGDLCELAPEENSLLMEEVCRAVRALRQVMKPDGFNVGVNLGVCAGAGIHEHLHFHVVPRWNGDTNLMPVLADVSVIPEHLLSTCRKLREAFKDSHLEIREMEDK